MKIALLPVAHESFLPSIKRLASSISYSADRRALVSGQQIPQSLPSQRPEELMPTPESTPMIVELHRSTKATRSTQSTLYSRRRAIEQLQGGLACREPHETRIPRVLHSARHRWSGSGGVAPTISTANHQSDDRCIESVLCFTPENGLSSNMYTWNRGARCCLSSPQ